MVLTDTGVEELQGSFFLDCMDALVLGILELREIELG